MENINAINATVAAQTTKVKKKISSRGGKRPGAGRPRGSRDVISVKALLETLDVKANGFNYEELLIEDFLKARATDAHLAQKYHQLIMNKVMNSLSNVTVTNTEDAVEAKREAFADAVAALGASNVKTIVPVKTESTVSKTVKGDGTNG